MRWIVGAPQDKAMPPGTRVRVAGRGDGTVEGFESHWIGANEYIIRFDSEGQPTAVKLRDQNWRVISASR